MLDKTAFYFLLYFDQNWSCFFSALKHIVLWKLGISHLVCDDLRLLVGCVLYLSRTPAAPNSKMWEASDIECHIRYCSMLRNGQQQTIVHKALNFASWPSFLLLLAVNQGDSASQLVPCSTSKTSFNDSISWQRGMLMQKTLASPILTSYLGKPSKKTQQKNTKKPAKQLGPGMLSWKIYACPCLSCFRFSIFSSRVIGGFKHSGFSSSLSNLGQLPGRSKTWSNFPSRNLIQPFSELDFFWKYCASATAIFGLLRAECGLNPGSSKYSLAAFNAYLHEGFATKKIHLTTVWHNQSKIQKMLVIPKFQTLTFQYFRSVFLPMAFSASFKSIFLVVNSLAFSVFVAWKKFKTTSS